MVLNSLLTPFDVSKSPESINTEEPVLELRGSVTIEREVKVPIKVRGPAFPIKVDALLVSQIDQFSLGPIRGSIGDIRREGLVDTQVESETGGTEGANGLSPMEEKSVTVLEGGAGF